MLLRKLSNGGDTIVEVLIAITITSFVLTAGYTAVRSNLIAERQAQERSQAVQIIQSQIESLRSMFNSGSSGQSLITQYNNGQAYCIDGPTTQPVNPATCNFNQQDIYIGGPSSGSPYYSVSITNKPQVGGVVVNEVSVNATWYRAGSGSLDNMTAVYRLN